MGKTSQPQASAATQKLVEALETFAGSVAEVLSDFPTTLKETQERQVRIREEIANAGRSEKAHSGQSGDSSGITPAQWERLQRRASQPKQ